ncbi:hypothetical protein QE152_g33583 [Popillia japonica]|uniref:Uncharacterized protein n=1 Tax=Popillia japonica TaxID=7064 RepID=A0AAW1IWR5_POPJA
MESNFMFRPLNTTAIIQSPDQNIIQLTKITYRKSLLSHILSSDEEAVFWHSRAWKSTSPVIIPKSWKKRINSDVIDSKEYQNQNTSILKPKITSAKQNIHLVSSMLQQLGGEVLTEAEVQSWICGDKNLLTLEENIQNESDDDRKRFFIKNNRLLQIKMTNFLNSTPS